MVMEVAEEVDLKSNDDDIIAALKKYSVLCPDDEDRGVNEARTELCKPEETVADAICAEVIAGSSAEGKEVRISQSHSKKVIKHALRQQAKRRRKNTTIASGSSEHVVVKSAGLDAGHVTPCPAPQPMQPRPGMATMREVLASIPGFSVKPRRRSSKKLSTAAQLEQTKEGCVDLETPDSILAGTNLRLLLNKHTFSALPPLYQYKLVQLLPAVDQADMSLRLSSSGLNNEFFARACLEWNERLSEGEFTPENQQRLKAEAEREMSRLDPWKLKHFEPIWGERHESYTFDGGSCADADRMAMKPGMKLRASAAVGRPAPRARTVGAVTRAITSCRDEPPPPPPRHKRHSDRGDDEIAKKAKPEPYAEPVATTAWDGQDAVDATEDDPFAPPDRFNDSDHSAYEPTVEHADDVIHESAILRPPVISGGKEPPPLQDARLLDTRQDVDETTDAAKKWTNQEDDESVSETRQAAVWTNQDEDERILAVPEEWSRDECRSEGSAGPKPGKVLEDSVEREPVEPVAVDLSESQLKDCGSVQSAADVCGTVQTKLEDFKMVQSKLADFEAAQTKLAEFEIAQAKLAEFNAVQTKLAEFKSAQTKLAEFEIAQAKLAELKAAQTKLAEFEATQIKLAEFEATQTKLAEFEATQTKLTEFEATQIKLTEFEATQTNPEQFEAGKNKLEEFEAGETQIEMFDAGETKIEMFDACETKIEMFEAGETKIAEFEATQTKQVKHEVDESNLVECDTEPSGKYADSGLQLHRPPFDVKQTRLVEFSCEETGSQETSQQASEGFQTPDPSGGLVETESKTSDLDESTDKMTDFEQAQLDEFGQSADFGQITAICEDFRQANAAEEDFHPASAVTEDYNETSVVPKEFIQLHELSENSGTRPDSHLGHFEQEGSTQCNTFDVTPENRSPAESSDISDPKPDCSIESSIKQEDFIGSSEKNEDFQQETGRVDLYKQTVSNTEDCTHTESEIDEFRRSQSDLAQVIQLPGKPDVYCSTVNLLDYKSESKVEGFSQSENVETFCQPGTNTEGSTNTSSNVDELGQSSYSQPPSNIEDFSQQTTNIQMCNQPRPNETGFSHPDSNIKVLIQPRGNVDGFSQICDVAVEHYDGSAEMEAALRLAVSREWETKCVGEVKVIPMHEELEVRLEEGSFPVERDLNTMNWYPVATESGRAGNATGETATGEAYSSGQALKLELEVTLTPEASTMGGPAMSVIPPTTIVCLPSMVVSSPHLATPGGGCGRPVSSSAVPYLALSGATPLRAITQLHKPGSVGVPAIGGKQKPPRDAAQGTAPSGRNSRGASNRPPPGAVNLERSYQICQAVIQNSPNRDQLRAQLKPPPPLLTGPKRTGPPGPPHPGLVTGAKGVRALPPPGPRAAAPTATRNALYERPLRLPSPPPPPPGVGAGVVRHVFTSAHGIPVTMAVLPQGGGGGAQEVTIAQDAMGGGGQYILVHRTGEPEMQLAGRRNPGPPRASSAPPANRNVGAGGVRPMGGRGRPASVDVRQEYVCPPERYLVACPSPGTQAVSRRRDLPQHGMSYADVGDAAAPGRPDLSTAPRAAPRQSFGAVGGVSFAAQCGCNARPMVVCRKCGAFCHDDCVSPASICGSCLVR